MLYLKRNLNGFERGARLVLALCLVVAAHAWVPAGWLAMGAYAAAAIAACTAIVGFCPACALADRTSGRRDA